MIDKAYILPGNMDGNLASLWLDSAVNSKGVSWIILDVQKHRFLFIQYESTIILDVWRFPRPRGFSRIPPFTAH